MSSHPLSALILERNCCHRLVVAKVLHESGCEQVYSVSTPAEALATLAEVGPVDLLICGIRTEGIDALDFVQILGERKLTSTIIMKSKLPQDLWQAVRQVAWLQGLELLGTPEEALSRASLATLMTQYKRNACRAPRPGASWSPASEHEVRLGLVQGEFHTHYQPKFNLQTGDIRGVEALARWQHPTKGLLAPSSFIPTLERCGLMGELLFTQLQQGLQMQQQAWQRGYFLNLAINLHPAQLSEDDLVSRIKSLLLTHKMPGNALTFELTEQGLIDTDVTVMKNLVRLRMLGCRLAIDDFGTGYSSLHRLCHLPFNEIKIDREFVSQLSLDNRSRVAISSTVELGEALGMSVTVEGVETEEQRSELITLGCQEAQGYLCAAPLAQEELFRWLERRTSQTRLALLHPTSPNTPTNTAWRENDAILKSTVIERLRMRGHVAAGLSEH